MERSSELAAVLQTIYTAVSNGDANTSRSCSAGLTGCCSSHTQQYDILYDLLAFVLPDGSVAPFRITAVFHRENGNWRLVQEHASVAVSNVEVIGTSLDN